jgi:hypothetical protein
VAPPDHRTVRDHFAWGGPEPRCDCDLLPTEYCCQEADLVHTRLIDHQQLDLSLDDGRQHASGGVRNFVCEAC